MPGSRRDPKPAPALFCARALSPNSLAQRRISGNTEVAPRPCDAGSVPDRLQRHATQRDRYGHEPGSVAASVRCSATSIRIWPAGRDISLRSLKIIPINASRARIMVSRACIMALTAGPRQTTRRRRRHRGVEYPIGGVLRSSEDQTTVPDFLEFRARHHLRTRRGRTQHERSVVVNLAGSKNPPSRSDAIPGSLRLASRVHCAFREPTSTPNWRAQRSSARIPTVLLPQRSRS